MIVTVLMFLFLPVFSLLAFGGGLPKTGFVFALVFMLIGGVLLS